MGQIRKSLLILFTACVGCAPAMGGGASDNPPLRAYGVVEKRTFKGANGQRNYILYIPATVQAQTTRTGGGLLMMLHGCVQTAAQFSDGTQMNQWADRYGFIVAYPEQTSEYNSLSCWNWFKPENLRRDGEAALLSGIASSLVQEFALNKQQVFVAGLSAGAAMAANLLACYSDVFSGAAIHSGLEYAAADSESKAQTVMRTGSSEDLNKTARAAVQCSPARRAPVRAMVIHGRQDTVVNPINGDRAAQQVLLVNDLLDDEQLNSSLNLRQTQRSIGKDLVAEVTESSSGSTILLMKIQVAGMAHAWSGGKANAPFMEPRGPNISEEIAKFFFASQRN